MTQNSNHNKDRIRRVNSWLDHSRKVTSADEKFIFLWIAFNAAYGVEPKRGRGSYSYPKHDELNVIEKFLENILKKDTSQTIQSILFEKSRADWFKQSIQRIMKNEFLYDPYWQEVRNGSGRAWEKKFKANNEAMLNNYKDCKIKPVLVAVLFRLYTLRNQIFHGGRTFAASWGKKALEDGGKIMAELVPAVLSVMKAHSRSDIWGRVAYPRPQKQR